LAEFVLTGRALGRRPRHAEKEVVKNLIKKAERSRTTHTSPTPGSIVLARVFLNVDEFITRE